MQILFQRGYYIIVSVTLYRRVSKDKVSKRM
jgi:hypothetical protein